MVSKEEARQIGADDVAHLLNTRRLALLVDLDQTLIHTTMDNVSNNLKVILFRIKITSCFAVNPPFSFSTNFSFVDRMCIIFKCKDKISLGITLNCAQELANF